MGNIKNESKQNEIRVLLLLSLQKALLGMITPNIRAVYANWDDKQVALFFIFMGSFLRMKQRMLAVLKRKFLLITW